VALSCAFSYSPILGVAELSLSLNQLTKKVAEHHNLDFDIVFKIITDVFLQMALNGYVVVEKKKYDELKKKVKLKSIKRNGKKK